MRLWQSWRCRQSKGYEEFSMTIKLGDREFFGTWEEMVQPKHTALLVIDMQNDYFHPDGYYIAKLKLDLSMIHATAAPIQRALAAARQAGVQVIYSKHVILPGMVSDSPLWLSIHYNAGLRDLKQDFYTVAGTWGAEIIDELKPQPGDWVLEKMRSNVFIGTSLETLLRSNRIETLVIAGQVTNGCVENTARTARDLDYYTVLLKDGVASTSKVNHDATMTNLGKRLPCPSAEELAGVWSAS
jgi:nicotinamidase-related amidase